MKFPPSRWLILIPNVFHVYMINVIQSYITACILVLIYQLVYVYAWYEIFDIFKISIDMIRKLYALNLHVIMIVILIMSVNYLLKFMDIIQTCLIVSIMPDFLMVT